MRTPEHLQSRGGRRGPIGGTRRHRELPTRRTVYLPGSISLWGWPSRGGLIVLEDATALDFEFLGLDNINPPLRRDPNQDNEDRLCRRLLLLGARWFDSRERYGTTTDTADSHDPTITDLEDGQTRPPTLMESRWVRVGYPASTEGGFWVAEFDTPLWTPREPHNLVPPQAAGVALAKTMDEKCEIIQRIGGKFYASLGDYDGAACLKAWEEKAKGEFGPLQQTKYEEEPPSTRKEVEDV